MQLLSFAPDDQSPRGQRRRAAAAEPLPRSGAGGHLSGGVHAANAHADSDKADSDSAETHARAGAGARACADDSDSGKTEAGACACAKDYNANP